MKNYINLFIAFCVAGSFSINSSAHAAYEYKVFHISTVGVDEPLRGFFKTVEPFGGGCLHNIAYINLATEGGKAMQAMVISAKIANRTINSVTYNMDDRKCYVTGLTLGEIP